MGAKLKPEKIEAQAQALAVEDLEQKIREKAGFFLRKYSGFLNFL